MNMTTTPPIHILDLNFQNCPNAIASYLVPHNRGIILIESGPGSTQQQLLKNLAGLGYELDDLTHILLTHIHLDHAGAAGWLAQKGAEVYVHERGYPHLINPEKLLASAARIYQDKMDSLWGEFLPVPEKQLHVIHDGDEIQISSLVFRCLDTPGHANHHMAYLLDDICFSGDVGGVRVNASGPRNLRVPMPPPEFHPPRWRDSIHKLKSEQISRIAPTHFGFFEDVEWHLDAVLLELDAVEDWMREIMPRDLPITELRYEFVSWVKHRAESLGLDHHTIEAFENANPSGMSADGIKRYWDKYINT